MKRYIHLVLLFSFFNLKAQVNLETIHIKTDSVVKKEIKLLRNNNIKNIIALYDNQGNIIIYWKEKNIEKGIKHYYKNCDYRKYIKKKIRINKKRKMHLDNFFKSYKIIKEIKKAKCVGAEQCNPINIVSFMDGENSFTKKLFFHSESESYRRKLNSVIQLSRDIL